MPLYTVTRTATALVPGNDFCTIIASATKPLRIYMADVKGMGNSSAANEVALMRSTSGTTPGGAITPVKVNPSSGAASFTVSTTWSVQPTPGDVLWRFGPNANGGIDKFVALPGAEFPVPVGQQISIRPVSGTSSTVLNMLIEEIDG
jgi:hypothetical protein